MIYAAMPCLGLPHFFRFVTVRRLHLRHEAFCSLARHIPHPASKDLCSSGSLGNDSKQPWRLSLYFFSPQGSGDNPVVRDAPDIFAGAGWQEVFFWGFVWHYLLFPLTFAQNRWLVRTPHMSIHVSIHLRKVEPGNTRCWEIWFMGCFSTTASVSQIWPPPKKTIHQIVFGFVFIHLPKIADNITWFTFR